MGTLIFFVSCSSSEETQKNQDTEKEKTVDSIYIFDEVPPEDLFKLESPNRKSYDVYVIQIGAFSNFDRAKEFADQSWTKLDKEIKVEFSQEKNLYLVWIYPSFQDKKSAEQYRTEIQQGGEFSDAWIL
ncbi:MAG TPA: SPOR domain-containing protein, partial [Ignavibacteriaceae bacterium]